MQASQAVPQDREMTLVEHLSELRRRLIYLLISVPIAFCAGYAAVPRLLRALASKLPPGANLAVVGIGEAFFTTLKLAFWLSLLAIMPIAMWQAYLFVRPALTPTEARVVRWLLPTSYVLFLASLAFGYWLVLPAACSLFLSFSGSMVPVLSIERFVDFYLNVCAGLGLAFQTPVVICILSGLRIVSARTLSRQRKYVILALVIAAAVISPTVDPISLIMYALPLWVLFEMGLFIAGRLWRQ